MLILHLLPCLASTCPTRARRCVRESFLTTLLSSFTARSWKCSISMRLPAERPSRYERGLGIQESSAACPEQLKTTHVSVIVAALPRADVCRTQPAAEH